MSSINKKSLEYLAQLAKIELVEHEPADASPSREATDEQNKAMKGKEEKLLKDLGEILNYFEQLKEVDTSDVEPMTGGTAQKNVFREDKSDVRKQINASAEDLIEAFPEKEGRFLKVPPVFE